MKVEKHIPGLDLPNLHNKPFEFAIVSNREILDYNIPTNHDPFRPHRINFYAILFILEGNGKHFIDFKSYDYQKGSIVFIAKDQVQAFQKNEDREAFFLLFTENFIERGSLSSNLMQELSLYNYHLYSPVINLQEDEMNIFKSLVKRIKKEYNAPDDNLTEEIIQSSLKIFLGLSERIRKKNQSTLTVSKYQIEFIQFQNLLNKHLFNSRQVQFYANEMNMSTKKLNRITQELMNKPVKTYINDSLILEIKRLLMNTSLSIKEISYKTGFEDPTNFVKYFKKYTELTPVDFRNKY
ncbi:MAG: helix-turn-helix transcriptional regulator [Saprospiraceae bacterium]